MRETNVSEWQKSFSALLTEAIETGDPIRICTEKGNAVVLSEEDYRSLMETLYLCSQPGMKEKILDGMHTPLSECIPEENVGW